MQLELALSESPAAAADAVGTARPQSCARRSSTDWRWPSPRRPCRQSNPRRTAMSEIDKIKPSHLSRMALVYVRQSSAAQVEHNRESTLRQYALAQRAAALGWPQATDHRHRRRPRPVGLERPPSRRLCPHGRRCGARPRGPHPRAGGLAPGAQQRRLVPAARSVRDDRHAHRRRRRPVPPVAVQRSAAARPEGHHERGGAARAARAAGRGHSQQGRARRAAPRPARGLRLGRCRRRGAAAPGRSGERCRARGLRALRRVRLGASGLAVVSQRGAELSDAAPRPRPDAAG